MQNNKKIPECIEAYKNALKLSPNDDDARQNLQKALQQQKQDGVKRKLVGFEMVERGIPRHDYEIVDAEGNNIGKVTSGTQSPSLQKAIGMGYVKNEFAKEGTEIFINIRDNKIKAKIVKPPFSK